MRTSISVLTGNNSSGVCALVVRCLEVCPCSLPTSYIVRLSEK